ncbi:MAG: hypothetical protein DWQ47_06160 [Acidobacteria bacterium]|nr:MAG: hypothetical protein DWQ38_06145 [Acidobacteriota bacterium]REK14918.1 MAG: hypothetical protein DWQ43_15400 [Acidobacteriota bacterium]REK45633.1 MAG: hypothetical protein DWQ47_06160 [Acidobacteriota bacterium]
MHLIFRIPRRFFLSAAVITGFNTDVSYDGVTYHVQTEDKGLDTPLILSLVFDRGTILAAKRSPYDDLIADGLDEKALEARLQRQHKLMCAAIRAGRLEDLKKLSAKTVQAVVVEGEIDLSSGIPMPDNPPVWDIPIIEDIEIDVVEEDIGSSSINQEAAPVLDSRNVTVVDEISKFESPSGDRLRIKLVGAEKFVAGDRKNVNVLVCRGSDDDSVPGANVMIKILGSDFRPLIYHSKADSNGVAGVMVKIPSFRTGRAAILVRAMIGSEEAELRRVIAHDR